MGTLYQGRAQVASAYLVQANTGAATRPSPTVVHAGQYAGSHGNSQIIGPGGAILARAGHTQEQIVMADIPVVGDAAADGPGAVHGGMDDPNPLFAKWLRDGLDLLGRMPV